MSQAVVDIGAVVARPANRHAERMALASDRTISHLRKELERYRTDRARRAGWERRFVATGLAPLDERLPHGGLPCGAIAEIVADAPGVGAMTLAMRIARRANYELQKADACRAFVVIDTQGDFYPPAALQHGIDLDRLIVLRTRNEQDAFWAADQVLRCPAVGAVLAPLGTLNDRLARRLQLAAESSGCVGIILRAGSRPTHRFATVRIRIEALPITGRLASVNWQLAIGNRQFVCRLTLLTVREGSPTEPFLVDLDHETGDGSLPAVSLDRAKTG